MSHSFIICAHKVSAYLETLVRSIEAQTYESKVLFTTSTPTGFLSALASKHNIEVRENLAIEGIAADWNFAYAQAETDYVTLAHQDDVYEPDFAEKVVSALENEKNPVLAFTDYYELREGRRIDRNKNLKIKRAMLSSIRTFPNSVFVRNRVLSMGNPICCPSVTFNKRRFPDFTFETSYQNSMDWEAWTRFADHKGAFLYLPQKLMGHRIHEESETTNMIESGNRTREDYTIFLKYWPRPIAKRFMKQYKKSMKSNTLTKTK